MSIIAFCDGSAHPNPGPGGFGAIVIEQNKNDYQIVETYTEQFDKCTNNICELKSILYVFLKYGICINDNEFVEVPVVYSDSSYAINVFDNWMFSWQKNGWLKSDNKTPENLEIIQTYYNWYKKGYRIELRKVKGHDGHFGNEMADLLATGKASPEQAKKIIEENLIKINNERAFY